MVREVGEGQARFWDIWIKIIGGLIAIGTLIIGFNTLSRQGDQLQFQQQQLKAQQDEQVKAMEEEYHRRFWDKKLDVYMRLCQAASSLTLAQPESDEYTQANHELMLIYGGEFQVVASPEVKKAFGEFLFAVSSNLYSKAKNIAQAIKVPHIDWGKLSAISPTPSSKGEIADTKVIIDWSKFDWSTFFDPDLHQSLTALALACRQDSGSEFHLSAEQVEKFNKTTDDIIKGIQKYQY
jgi:hypothetical protein